jgi:MtN3 and saliva related transmembrane protein
MRSILAVTATSWGLLMSLAPLLQVRVILRQRDSTGVSITWIAILLTGFILWLCYGAAIGNLPIIVTNVVSCAVCAVTLAVVLLFRKRGPSSAP